jgi:hypothetical protein
VLREHIAHLAARLDTLPNNNKGLLPPLAADYELLAISKPKKSVIRTDTDEISRGLPATTCIPNPHPAPEKSGSQQPSTSRPLNVSGRPRLCKKRSSCRLPRFDGAFRAAGAGR